MIIFVATLVTILLLTKLGVKSRQQPMRVRVKTKRKIVAYLFINSPLIA